MSTELKLLLYFAGGGVLLYLAVTPFIVRLGIAGPAILPLCGVPI